MRTGDQGRTVAGRILSVFEAFEGHGPLLSLTEIAAHARLPMSTAHRIVGELLEWGALSRDVQGRFQVGLRLWELAQNASRKIRETARPLLQDLYALTGETVHIAVREGNEVLYVDRVYGTKRVPRASRIGGRLPMHATAVGKVLLAREEQWFRDAYLEGELSALTAHTRVDADELAAELAQIAQQGYAITGEEAREGACSIAVPVELDRHAVPESTEAAIGIVCLASQLESLPRYLPALRGIAHRIELAFQLRGTSAPALSRFR